MSKGYRKRVGVEVQAVNVDLEVQDVVDLRAMAAQERLSLSQAVGKCIRREVRRRERKMIEVSGGSHEIKADCQEESLF